MVKTRFDPEIVPDSGWGVNSDVSLHFEDHPDIKVWTTEDNITKDLTREEKGNLNILPRKFPSWVKVYGIWNVTRAQLDDPTWKPIPYHILDDACMVIVMSLCETNKQRSDHWPWNFDSNGNPRQTRLRFGPGVYCHFGDQTEDGEWESKISSYLTYKRQYILGGSVSESLVLSGGGKSDRMKLSNSELSHWSHGLVGVGEDNSIEDSNPDWTLTFYITKDGQNKVEPWDPEVFQTNLNGVWFERMHEQAEIPVMVDPAYHDRPRIPRDQSIADVTDPEIEKTTKKTRTITMRDKQKSILQAPIQVTAEIPSRTQAASALGQGTVETPGQEKASLIRGGRDLTSGRRTNTLLVSGKGGNVRLVAQRTSTITTTSLPTTIARVVASQATTQETHAFKLRKRSAVGNPVYQTTTKRQKKDTSLDTNLIQADRYPRNNPETALIDGSNLKDVKKERSVLQRWFTHFDHEFPTTCKEAEPKALGVHTAVAAWKAMTEGGISTVEASQDHAVEIFDRRLADLKTLSAQLDAMQDLFTRQVDSFMQNIERQPADEYLRAAQTSAKELVTMGQMGSARYVVAAVLTRLTREPALFYEFDIDRDLPEAGRHLVQPNILSPRRVQRGPSEVLATGVEEQSEDTREKALTRLPDVMEL